MSERRWAMVPLYRVYAITVAGSVVVGVFQEEDDADLFAIGYSTRTDDVTEVVEHSVPDSFYNSIFLCR